MGHRYSVHVDDWHPEYGQPNRIAEIDRDRAPPPLVEDTEHGRWLPHAGVSLSQEMPSMAFVDGVRRTEGFLFARDLESGRELRGLAGSFACGAVLVERDRLPCFEGCRAERVAIWGSSPDTEPDDLPRVPDVSGGFRWQPVAIAGEELHEPLRALENQMRRAEGALADELAQKARLTIVDGPLEFVTRHTRAVVGYIKTHHQQWLAPAEHLRIPDLPLGHRTSLFGLRDDLYSAYVRVGDPSTVGNRWNGIARIEVPRSLGVDHAVIIADQLASVLPRFAGVPHRDPRAPQNLQPVGALETFLRRLLGNASLTRRATRDAMAARMRS